MLLLKLFHQSTENFYYIFKRNRYKEVKKEPKVAEIEEQTTFSFDLPFAKQELKKSKKNEVLFDLTNENREIKVNEPVQFYSCN
jgi:cell division protein FtsZ